MVDTVVFPDTAKDTTKTMVPDDDHPEGVFVNIEVADIIEMKNNTLKNEFYLLKGKSSGKKKCNDHLTNNHNKLEETKIH